MNAKTIAKIEQTVGTKIVHGWHLDGAGPARFGWASVHPARVRFLGRTLAEVAASVGV